MDRVHAYASVANESVCWVCNKLLLTTFAGLPWHMSPASVSNWTWWQGGGASTWSVAVHCMCWPWVSRVVQAKVKLDLVTTPME